MKEILSFVTTETKVSRTMLNAKEGERQIMDDFTRVINKAKQVNR